jgi:ABC-2 type transport system ATP-binding protein
MIAVELDHVSKTYSRKVAVQDLTLRIAPGDIFGLLGPNGAGKTSSIRITLPDSGTVRLFDEPFRRALLRRVGYLPEERGLYKRMKTLEQLVFLGQLHGLDRATAEKRARSWATKLDLTESLEKKPAELSKGLQQKVQFVAALLHEPDLIIMDEPFAGLDPVNSQLLEATLLELRAAGRAILFSTHRMDQVERLCDSICLVDHGRAVLAGSMREVKSRYPTDRIALAFAGDRSFLSDPSIIEVKDRGNHLELRLQDQADPQRILHLAAAGARISRFELMEPSLEEIFIRAVGNHAVQEKTDA